MLFENCEEMSIPYSMIGVFIVDGIRDVIRRISVNEINKYSVADTVVMELFNEGDVPYIPFGSDNDETTKFERLKKWRDIAQIIISYDDGTEERYLMNYDEEGDYLGASNARQKVYKSGLGNLYIVIDDKPLTEWFDKKRVNDKEAMDFKKKAFSICTGGG